MSSFALSLKSRQPRTLMSSVMLNEHSFSSRKGFTWWCVKNRFFSGLVNLPLNSDSGTYLTCNFPKVTYVVSGETGLQMSWAWFLGPNPSHYTTMPLKESFQWHHGLGVFFFLVSLMWYFNIKIHTHLLFFQSHMNGKKAARLWRTCSPPYIRVHIYK